MKPKISILLPAMKGFESVLAALDAWEAQTRREALEILILCPDHLGPTDQQKRELTPGQIIIMVGNADLHEARALGTGKAASEYVMLAEDHCLPDPEWTQAMLDRLDEGWDAIGPALRAGNRNNVWAEGSFLIGYGEWMMPITSGPAKILCGWNGIVRTQLLRQAESSLSDEMLVGAFLIRRLKRQNCRFYLEARARMRHFDLPGWSYESFLLTIVGLGFGALRTRTWPLAARLLYPLAAPAIAFLHWKRAFIHYRRSGSSCGMSLSTLAAASLLAMAWGLGEGAGAVLGVNRVAPHLWRTEVKPVSREEVAQSTAQEAALSG